MAENKEIEEVEVDVTPQVSSASVIVESQIKKVPTDQHLSFYFTDKKTEKDFSEFMYTEKHGIL